MKHFAKWTFLLIMAGLVGFSATVLATQSTRLASLLSQDRSAETHSEILSEVELTQIQEAGSAALEPAVAGAVENSAEDVAPALVALDAPSVQTASIAATNLQPAQIQTGAPAAQNTEQSPSVVTAAGLLSAVGTVEVAQDRQVVLATSGQVQEIAVEVGDQVQAGDLLISLDTTFLDWSLEQAEINFETERIRFEELGETVLESDVAVAEANLLLAQENLAQAQQGPTTEEMAAAQASALAAWARYEELKEQPTQAQINQALASLRRAEVNVEAAQREYDTIAWLPEASATSAADALHRATIDFEAAKAAFEEVNRPARESELQGAVSSAQSAQAALNQLRLRPTPAEIADAEARLAAAEAAYEQALLGPKESDMRIGEMSLRQAMIGLEQARLALENAQVRAPIDGTILDINVNLGEQASSGSVVATVADPRDVRLVVNVEQRDIRFVTMGQGVEISVYSLPDVIFLGVVDKIAPVAGAGATFVTFPVMIELIDGPMERILPGMTASATFLSEPANDRDAEEEAAPDSDDEAMEEEPAVEEPAVDDAASNEDAANNAADDANHETQENAESEDAADADDASDDVVDPNGDVADDGAGDEDSE